MGSQFNIDKQRGSCGDYNANITWCFNGSNGCLNNNNRYNTNFRSRPVFDYGLYDNANLDNYPIPLSDNHKVTIRRGYTKTDYYKHEYKELKHMLAA